MLKEKFDLKDKVALVTGAGRGIGKGLSEALAEFGSSIAVADIDYKYAKTTASEIKSKYNVDVIPLRVDVKSQNSVCNIIDKIMKHFGKLDIGVNNAGIATKESAENISVQMWDELMAVDLRGVFLCCREEAKIMMANEGGSIINIASQSGVVVNNIFYSHYITAKAGVIMLTKALAVEWADYKIRVNCISPGYTMTRSILTSENRKLHEKWKESIPLKRLGEVEDLMGAAVFLASDASSYITGHNLLVEGGLTLI